MTPGCAISVPATWSTTAADCAVSTGYSMPGAARSTGCTRIGPWTPPWHRRCWRCAARTASRCWRPPRVARLPGWAWACARAGSRSRPTAPRWPRCAHCWPMPTASWSPADSGNAALKARFVQPILHASTKCRILVSALACRSPSSNLLAMSPRWMRPSRTASSSASGTEAADVLPCRSTVTTT